MAFLWHMKATRGNCAQATRKDSVLRARCPDALKTNVNYAAQTIGMDPADFVRIVLENTAEIVARGGKAAFYKLYAAS